MGLGHGICVVGKAMSGLDIERLNLGLGCNAARKKKLPPDMNRSGSVKCSGLMNTGCS